MNRCARNGCLVDAKLPFPTDPTELYVERLPPLGCSRLRCINCGAQVRNVTGVAFATRDDVSPAKLSELYELKDLATSPLLTATHPDYRLYVCRCRRWLEISSHVLDHHDNKDDPTAPDLPWRCDGHPAIEFPHDVHGVGVASPDDLRALATRAFHGFDPPNAPRGEVDAQWLTRLYYRLSPHDAGALAQVATACLSDPDPTARQRALHFFDDVRDASARERLAELLSTKRDLFASAHDKLPLHQADTTLEHTAWRILRESIGNPGRARDLARADALAGRASRALYDALCRADADWLIQHVEDVARAAPDRAEDLETSFNVAPDVARYKQLRGRARGAVGKA